MFLDQRDGGQEAGTLQAILVKPVRHDIGGTDQGHTTAEQAIHQRCQYHGVTDVRDKKFVKADHPGFVRKHFRHDIQRVFLAFQAFQFLVNTLHKPVEVHPHLAIKGQSFIERIHEVSFTATHAAPEIQTLHRIFFALLELEAKFDHRFVPLPFRRHQFVVK